MMMAGGILFYLGSFCAYIRIEFYFVVHSLDSLDSMIQ